MASVRVVGRCIDCKAEESKSDEWIGGRRESDRRASRGDEREREQDERGRSKRGRGRKKKRTK